MKRWSCGRLGHPVLRLEQQKLQGGNLLAGRLDECIALLAAVEKCKRLFAMNPMQVQQGATRGFAYPHQAPEDRIFDFFLSDPFNPVMSVSPETVPYTRSEQFRRTVQRRAGNYRRH